MELYCICIGVVNGNVSQKNEVVCPESNTHIVNVEEYGLYAIESAREEKNVHFHLVVQSKRKELHTRDKNMQLL